MVIKITSYASIPDFPGKSISTHDCGYLRYVVETSHLGCPFFRGNKHWSRSVVDMFTTRCPRGVTVCKPRPNSKFIGGAPSDGIQNSEFYYTAGDWSPCKFIQNRR